jgi:indolepyruvate ferredoxin oxidoreductase beta subunit
VAGVGGQGVLTAAALVTETARRVGRTVRQGEIHGMSQRGGAVTAHVRVAAGPVWSEVVERGAANMILALEPLEALRSLPWLAEGGVVVSAASPVENLPGYPPREEVLAELHRLPAAVVVDARAQARKAGSVKAENVVLLGAAARWLPVPIEALREVVASWFEDQGEEVATRNLRAFDAGLAAAAGSDAPE